MKFNKLLVFTALIALLLQACSTSQNVAENGIIQKRKYRHGYHLNLKHNTDKMVANVSTENQKNKQDIAGKSEESDNSSNVNNQNDELIASTNDESAKEEIGSTSTTETLIAKSQKGKDKYTPPVSSSKSSPFKTLKNYRKAAKSLKQASSAAGSTDSMGMISLILGAVGFFFMILGLVVPYLYWLAFPLFVVGLIMGIIGDSKTGKLLNILGLVLWLLLLIVVVVIIILILGAIL